VVSDRKKAEEWINEGVKLAEQGKFEEALKCFERALEIDPKDAAAWYNKGNALYDLGRYEEAIECYDRALEIKSNYKLAIKSRKIIKRKAKQIECEKVPRLKLYMKELGKVESELSDLASKALKCGITTTILFDTDSFKDKVEYEKGLEEIKIII